MRPLAFHAIPSSSRTRPSSPFTASEDVGGADVVGRAHRLASSGWRRPSRLASASACSSACAELGRLAILRLTLLGGLALDVGAELGKGPEVDRPAEAADIRQRDDRRPRGCSSRGVVMATGPTHGPETVLFGTQRWRTRRAPSAAGRRSIRRRASAPPDVLALQEGCAATADDDDDTSGDPGGMKGRGRSCGRPMLRMTMLAISSRAIRAPRSGLQARWRLDDRVGQG